jgi:2-methylcitrate dehydratase PrpD
MRKASTWDQPTLGVIAASLTVSKAMGLDQERIEAIDSLQISLSERRVPCP